MRNQSPPSHLQQMWYDSVSRLESTSLVCTSWFWAQRCPDARSKDGCNLCFTPFTVEVVHSASLFSTWNVKQSVEPLRQITMDSVEMTETYILTLPTAFLEAVSNR